MIGGLDKAPFALLPDPVKTFTARAERFDFLAREHQLAPYLSFLAEIARIQARLCADLPPLDRLPEARITLARESRMPPIDRASLAGDGSLDATLTALCDRIADINLPEPARLAVRAVQAADDDDRRWLLGNVLAHAIPEDSAGPHMLAAAAVQVHLARLAATLDTGALVPISVGVCPSCGGQPVSSSVTGAQGVENVRYCACATCATRWNEVRIKCLCCGSTKGISYRSAEDEGATIKAEVCSECSSWVKILYQVKNASLDPVADDVGSLGLDMLMKGTQFRRGGFHPFTAGY